MIIVGLLDVEPVAKVLEGGEVREPAATGEHFYFYKGGGGRESKYKSGLQN